MNSKRDLRIFMISFFGTLCLLGLFFGLAEVDYQSRRIGFGDGKTLIYRITGKNFNLACNAVEICYNNSIFILREPCKPL